MIKPQGRQRISKEDMYLNSAENFAYRSTCLKRKYGAVIVKDNRIITTGYNGAPSGLRHCTDIGGCERERLHIPSGQRHELCRALHAEQNAIIQAAKLGVSIDGATLFCTHQPCVICAKMIINSGISRVVYESGYPDEFSLDLFRQSGVTVEKFERT